MPQRNGREPPVETALPRKPAQGDHLVACRYTGIVISLIRIVIEQLYIIERTDTEHCQCIPVIELVIGLGQKVVVLRYERESSGTKDEIQVTAPRGEQVGATTICIRPFHVQPELGR